MYKLLRLEIACNKVQVVKSLIYFFIFVLLTQLGLIFALGKLSIEQDPSFLDIFSATIIGVMDGEEFDRRLIFRLSSYTLSILLIMYMAAGPIKNSLNGYFEAVNYRLLTRKKWFYAQLFLNISFSLVAVGLILISAILLSFLSSADFSLGFTEGYCITMIPFLRDVSLSPSVFIIFLFEHVLITFGILQIQTMLILNKPVLYSFGLIGLAILASLFLIPQWSPLAFASLLSSFIFSEAAAIHLFILVLFVISSVLLSFLYTMRADIYPLREEL